jgi:hypothetical protein
VDCSSRPTQPHLLVWRLRAYRTGELFGATGQHAKSQLLGGTRLALAGSIAQGTECCAASSISQRTRNFRLSHRRVASSPTTDGPPRTARLLVTNSARPLLTGHTALCGAASDGCLRVVGNRGRSTPDQARRCMCRNSGVPPRLVTTAFSVPGLDHRAADAQRVSSQASTANPTRAFWAGPQNATQ